MNAFNLSPIKEADFAIDPSFEGSTITIRFSGNADIRAQEPIKTLLTQLHDEVLRLRVSDITVDFRQLEFMNSSCFKSFVSWVSRAQELDADHQYKIRFCSNPQMHWQKRSLNALRCFAIDLITVETT